MVMTIRSVGLFKIGFVSSSRSEFGFVPLVCLKLASFRHAAPNLASFRRIAPKLASYRHRLHELASFRWFV